MLLKFITETVHIPKEQSTQLYQNYKEKNTSSQYIHYM